MVPRNLVEEFVRETLLSRRQHNADTEGVCWCALCTADMQALALSSLPPQYVTRREPLDGARSSRNGAVGLEVERAIRHVGGHPKHSASGAQTRTDPVAIVNFSFEIGFSTIEERVQRRSEFCECWDCRCDAVAFALNRFPPQYGVAFGGRSAFPESNRRQMAEEMAPFLDLGLQIATALPRH